MLPSLKMTRVLLLSWLLLTPLYVGWRTNVFGHLTKEDTSISLPDSSIVIEFQATTGPAARVVRGDVHSLLPDTLKHFRVDEVDIHGSGVWRFPDAYKYRIMLTGSVIGPTRDYGDGQFYPLFKYDSYTILNPDIWSLSDIGLMNWLAWWIAIAGSLLLYAGKKIWPLISRRLPGNS